MSILGGQRRLQYGTSAIDYELIYSERKLLAIHVHPDCSVIVDAPIGSELEEIEQKVLKRAGWILRQQRQFEGYVSPNPLPRRYVSGESYCYLGRQYRLKVVENGIERVTMSRGHLTVSVNDISDKTHISHLIDAWYRGHAQRVQ